MSGTGIGYGATALLCDVRYWHSVSRLDSALSQYRTPHSQAPPACASTARQRRGAYASTGHRIAAR
eukprot:864069-Rhodomonas_salina.1